MKDNPQLSEPQGPGTSKLDWRYFENTKVDRNELKGSKNFVKAQKQTTYIQKQTRTHTHTHIPPKYREKGGFKLASNQGQLS